MVSGKHGYRQVPRNLAECGMCKLFSVKTTSSESAYDLKDFLSRRHCA